MITDAQIDTAIRTAARDLSDHDQETLLLIMAQAAACHLSELESAESIARVRARLMREFGVGVKPPLTELQIRSAVYGCSDAKCICGKCAAARVEK